MTLSAAGCLLVPFTVQSQKSSPSPTSEEKVEYISHCGYQGCPGCPQSCDGCLSRSDGNIAVTVKYCRVRTCAVEKGVVNCGHCPDYACRVLKDLYARWKKKGMKESARKSRALLDEIHRKIFELN
jgi:hypothetical protein